MRVWQSEGMYIHLLPLVYIRSRTRAFVTLPERMLLPVWS
jgi:hypothetical protein